MFSGPECVLSGACPGELERDVLWPGRQASVSLMTCVPACPHVLMVSCLLDQSISDGGCDGVPSAGEPFGITLHICHSAFFFYSGVSPLFFLRISVSALILPICYCTLSTLSVNFFRILT